MREIVQEKRPGPAIADEGGAAVDLVAVLVCVTDGQPRVMTIRQGEALPSGPFELGHRSLQSGLRAWVERQTHHPLGYLEQLYTFADSDRTRSSGGRRAISISYLGLTREGPAEATAESAWHDWYDYFPWEDHRKGRPRFLEEDVAEQLRAWAQMGTDVVRRERWQRAAITFGLDGIAWNEELVLQRYELLYEASLVPEALRSRPVDGSIKVVPGRSMASDHRRILATAMARLRAKIKYRPVVFELMAPSFTLLQLQRAVEALAGRLVHKPNFRRLIEQQELVEETGATHFETKGRPAKLFRFRHAVLAERGVAGTKLPLSRA
jgi:hypothetical protein